MTKGTQYGAHGESSNQIIPIQKSFRDHGVSLAVTLGMENPGLATDAKALGVPTTISRWTNPNGRWEGGQDVLSWGPFERNDFVGRSIQMIFDKTNDTEHQNSDFFVPGYNEWCPNDPFQDDWVNPDGTRKNGRKPYPAGWKAMGEVFCMLLDKATERSHEAENLGLHPIRLALPGFNAGTPEYSEMVAFFGATLNGFNLAQRMRARGDLLLVHEGVFFNQPIDTGYGQQLPGAPIVPNSGTLNLRVNVAEYVIQQLIGTGIPWVAGEWYDGNTKDTDPAVRLAALKWYDTHARLSPWYRGVCAFELIDDPNSTWAKVDFTKTFQSAAMLNDMIAQKDIENTGMTNQQLINAVAAVGKSHNKNLVGQIPYDVLTACLANRAAEYTGPSPLTWGLTDAEKKQVADSLGLH
jgi:hypothetical protein